MVLTDIYVPSMDRTYDFWLDESCCISLLAEEICGMIRQREQLGQLWEKEEIVLFDAEKKTKLPGDKTLTECGIRDGSRMILV